MLVPQRVKNAEPFSKDDENILWKRDNSRNSHTTSTFQCYILYSIQWKRMLPIFHGKVEQGKDSLWMIVLVQRTVFVTFGKK